jgi:hypothetical protein
MVGLSGVLLAETRRYLWSGNIDEVDPTLAQPAPEEEEPVDYTQLEEVDEWDLQPKNKAVEQQSSGNE